MIDMADIMALRKDISSRFGRCSDDWPSHRAAHTVAGEIRVYRSGYATGDNDKVLG